MLRVPRPPLVIYASSAIFLSKYAINPQGGASFLFPITPAGRISIVSARFGLAITSESMGDSSIANDLSRTVFFGMIVNRFTIGVA
jgi:hypothetical protein